MDRLTRQQRSRLMGRVRGKDTAPELAVRRLAHGLGFRFRLHRRDLPGTPDMVFPRLRKAILVHGCFWHSHGCPAGRAPTSNTAFWNAKLDRNVRRDAENEDALRRLGWDVLVIWECETRRGEDLDRRLRAFLKPT